MTLSVVYPPKASGAKSALDIVAVHGLDGDAIDTWTHPKSNAFWLKDFLPDQIPDARILTFGYNAAAAFSDSTAEVIDHAKSLLASLVDKRDEPDEEKRPLIFIAHSLGGIVVKQALLQARLEPRYEAIRNATRGIIFFGTPHRGSDKAVYGKVLANVAQIMTRKPPARLLSALQTNSDVLLRLTSDFRFQLPQYQVISFYERRPMKLFSNLIVEKQSALLEVEHEEQIPVDANHSAMCKFATVEDDTFEKVWKRIRRMRKEAVLPGATTQTVTVDSYNKHFVVPHLLSPVFTGQDAICRCLDSSLALSPQPRGHIQRRFVLYGLGGSGKTQICVRYAQVHRERYWGVFWIDASTSDSIHQGLLQIAPLIQVDQDINNVKRALANTSQPWLLIFDNADDPRLSLTPHFPPGDRGDVVITSRNPECRQYSTVGAEEVGRLSPADAVVLLNKTVSGVAVEQDHNHGQSFNDSVGLQVVQLLGCLALAIVQAGAYIRETSCSLDEYLELYHHRQKEVLKYVPAHVGTDYRHTVYTTWQVSLDQIELIGDETSHHALTLLLLLCFYHHEQVPVQMFYQAWENWPGETSPLNDLLWADAGRDFSDYRRAIQAATALLASFSLIARDAESSLSMHPLVHEWCRTKLTLNERQSGIQRAISVMARSVSWDLRTEGYSFRRSLVSHVHMLLHCWENVDTELDEGMAGEWYSLALVLSDNGSAQEAIQLLGQVVAVRKSTLGAEHPDTLASMHNLAISYSDVGRRREALELTEEVVALRKSKLGPEHPDTLNSMHRLATDYSQAGRRREALELTEEVVALRKSKLGPEHPDTLASMHNLAIRYSEAGRRREGSELTEEVVALRKSKLGPEHPDTLASMHNLAIRYSEAGRRREALELAEEVVALQKSKLGPEHPDTLKSIHNLAIRYSEAGRRREALEFIEQVVALQKSKLGPEHPDTLNSMHSLAIRYSEAGRQREALQLLDQVIALQKVKLGPEHPDTVSSERWYTYMSRAPTEGCERTEASLRLRAQKTKLWQKFQLGKKSGNV